MANQSSVKRTEPLETCRRILASYAVKLILQNDQ